MSGLAHGLVQVAIIDAENEIYDQVSVENWQSQINALTQKRFFKVENYFKKDSKTQS